MDVLVKTPCTRRSSLLKNEHRSGKISDPRRNGLRFTCLFWLRSFSKRPTKQVKNFGRVPTQSVGVCRLATPRYMARAGQQKRDEFRNENLARGFERENPGTKQMHINTIPQ